MEIELPTFTQFLHEGAILSQRQAEDLSNAMVKKDEDQKIFILSDFFRSLNASDCYDLSLRLYMYWKRNLSMTDSQQASLQRIPDVTPRKGVTMKSPKHNTSMTTSNSNIKNRVLSPDTSDCDVKGISRSNTHNSGIFDSLHKIAQHRETLRSENEKKKMESEMEGCTFHPKTNTSRSNLSRSSTDVFERLQRDLRKEKKDFNEAKKAQKEMRGCTFQPEVLNPHDSSDASNANLSRTFDRLYRESQRRKNNSIDYELKKKELEVRGCTFTPAVTTRGDRGETSIDDGMARSEKLHKLHEERERKMLKKQIEKTMEESNKYSFKPQTYSSPTRRDDSKDVYERLLEWREQKNRKMEMKYKEKVTKEKEMSQERYLNSRKKDDNDVSKDQSSIHERLYQESTQQKAKKEKIVQDVLKDMGASFKPKTNVSRGSSVKGTKRQPLSLQFINVKEDKVEEDDKMPSQRENLPAPEQLSSGRRLFGAESKSLSQPTMNTEVRTATFGK